MVALSAVSFWCRHQDTFWLMTLPIAGLAAAVAYVLETHREFIDWRHHWGWDFLFALIYAMLLDRWIKEALLDEATPCDEVDEMRRSTIAVRFLTFATALCLLAIMMAPCSCIELNAVACAAAASVFVMLLPALAAHRPITLHEAFILGRPVQSQLFLLIGGAILVSLLTGLGLSRSRCCCPPSRGLWRWSRGCSGWSTACCWRAWAMAWPRSSVLSPTGSRPSRRIVRSAVSACARTRRSFGARASGPLTRIHMRA
jgi:hypothetical protein